MSSVRTSRVSFRPRITAERIIACGAIAIALAGIAKPEIMSLAGLGFDGTSPSATARHMTDPMPTGTIAVVRPTADAHPPMVHGLAGAIKPLRARE